MPGVGSTASRGYGHAHRKQVALLKAQHVDGMPCPYPWCRKPMYLWQALDGDHYSQPRVLGGGLPDRLAHASCNRSAGATLGNRLRGVRRRMARGGQAEVGPYGSGRGTTSRDW